MKAIILAGGFGSRLMPLTKNTPKPLMPIIDRPILYYIIRLLHLYNIVDIGMTLNYLSEKIIKEFKSGEKLNVNIEYFVEATPLGTAGCIKNAEEYLRADDDKDFLVISGDAFTDFNLGELVDYHKEKKAIITLATKKLNNPSGFGVLKKDENEMVTEFFEKPLCPPSNEVNTGIYVLDKKVFDYIPKGFQDFAKDIFPKLIGSIYAKSMSGFWSDIGTLPQYYDTNKYVSLNLQKYVTI